MEDRLQKFAALVDAETFTEAAELLHISQPALTTAIQKLERELGLELLARTGNRFQLTSAGRLAYIEGKELLTRRQNLKLQVANLKHERISLAIGMIDSMADALFSAPDALNTLEKSAEISLSINNSAQLCRDVEQGKLDFAIIARQPRQLSNRIAEINLGSEPLIFVTHTALAVDVQTALEQGKLPRFLSYNQASTTHRLISATAERNGVTLEPNFYSTSPEIILKLVLDQKGTAALPQLLIKSHIAEGSLTPIFIGNSYQVKRDIVAIKPVTRTLPSVADTVLAQVAKIVEVLTIEAAQYQAA